jgi:hypothetical protein
MSIADTKANPESMTCLKDHRYLTTDEEHIPPVPLFNFAAMTRQKHIMMIFWRAVVCGSRPFSSLFFKTKQ